MRQNIGMFVYCDVDVSVVARPIGSVFLKITATIVCGLAAITCLSWIMNRLVRLSCWTYQRLVHFVLNPLLLLYSFIHFHRHHNHIRLLKSCHTVTRKYYGK